MRERLSEQGRATIARERCCRAFTDCHGVGDWAVLVHTDHPSVRRPDERAHRELIAVQRGARIVRVHDVAATRDALRVWQAVEQHRRGDGR